MEEEIITGQQFINAVRADRIDLVELYIKQGGDLEFRDFNGMTALLWAEHYNCHDILQLLIDAGADINVTPSKCDFTALIYAVVNLNIKNVHILLMNGADITAKSSIIGTAYDAAKTYGYSELVEILQDVDAWKLKNTLLSKGTTVVKNSNIF